MTIVDCFDTKWLIFQAVMWRSSVVAAARIVGAGLAGSWAIGLLVLVGQVAGEVSGPSTILALVIAAITAVLTGDHLLLHACFHGNPRCQLLRNHTADSMYFSLLGANVLDWRTCLKASRAVRQ
jgi:fatty acid desaturase